MSISSVLHFSPVGRHDHGFPSFVAQSLTARQESNLILGVMSAFLVGCSGLALYALSAI